jgi:hypothetical protein
MRSTRFYFGQMADGSLPQVQTDTPPESINIVLLNSCRVSIAENHGVRDLPVSDSSPA